MNFTPPYQGAAYYPEDWPISQVDDDIALMLDARVNCIRIGEFAWSRMEPSEGRFDLDWIDLVLSKASAAGIATILCTPTCTPPAWLVELHPDCLTVDDRGVRNQHGARRHACPTSATYGEYCDRIVRALGERFGKDPRVIGWQIDNEMYPGGRGCCCDSCVARFRTAMETRYGTIERLNEAWGTDLWSQTYQSFGQLQAPRSDVWHHPSLNTWWMTEQSENYVRFTHRQAAILHELGATVVGTDMMPFGGLSYPRTHEPLDVVQFNHYNNMDNLWQAAFWMDYCRGILPAPFWNTETATCWNGATTANGYKDPGFCRANAWLPIALGGEANCYWLWRAHWSGQELMHGSVVDSWGRPLHIIDEVREIGAGFAASAAFLNDTRPVSPGIALHFSCWAWNLYEFQPQVNGFRYVDRLLDDLYRPLLDAQLRTDVLDPGADLADVKLLISSYLPNLEEGGLRDRLKGWIEAGGTWVVGPLSDNRTLDATKYRHGPYSVIEEWAGLRVRHQIPGDPQQFAVQWGDDHIAPGSVWYDGFDLDTARSLAVYLDGPLAGLCAVAEAKLGAGKLVVLGTMPRSAEMKALLLSLAEEHDIAPTVEASGSVLAAPRTGQGGDGTVLVEYGNRPAHVLVQRPSIDLLSGEAVSGELSLGPYEVRVLKAL